MLAAMNASVQIPPGAAAATADALIACPRCDALHRAVPPGPGGRARCTRCATTLIAPRGVAAVHVVGLSLTSFVLMTAAVFLPFIDIRAGGTDRASSIFDAGRAFMGGPLAPLSILVVAVIVLVPLMRAALAVWALGPLTLGLRPLPGALWAFRLEEDLRPWAMTEIFVIGVSIALVKIAALAVVTLGPAFWMLAVLVVVVAAQDGLMDRWSLWRALERGQGAKGAAPAVAPASAPAMSLPSR